MFALQEVSSEAEFDVFKELLEEYARTDLADPKNSTIWADIAQLPGRYANPDGAAWLAWEGCELAGCGAFCATASDGMAEIKRVYVRRAFRRRGLARHMTQTLLATACGNGYQTAAISTWPDNLGALALYKQLGFQPIDPFKQHSHDALIFLGLPIAAEMYNEVIST